jgi:hypothetical protein
MKDCLLDIDNDLQFANGDFVTGESTQQHQNLLLISSKGAWKENPTVGVGAAGFLKDDDVNGLLAEIKQQFEKDGMKVKSIDYKDEKINIDASY